MRLLIFLITPFVCLASKQYKVDYMEGVRSIMVMITQFDTETKSQKTLQATLTRKGVYFDKDSIKTKENALKIWQFLDDNGFLSDFAEDVKLNMKRDPFKGLEPFPYTTIENLFLKYGLVVTAYHKGVDKQNNLEITAFFSKLNLN